MNTDEHRFGGDQAETLVVKASRLRRVFAYYLDLWVLAPIVHVLCYAASIYQYRWPITITLFFLIEWIVSRFYIRSLGDYALGITRQPEHGPLVDTALKSAANWFVMLVGFMELHSASRILFGGVVEYQLYYLYGERLSGFQAKFFLAFLGLLGIFLAMIVFRCKRYALPLVVGFALFELGNNFSSLPLATELSEFAIAQRNALRPGRELPITAEQLVIFQLAWNVAYLAFVTALGFLFRRRFRFNGEGGLRRV